MALNGRMIVAFIEVLVFLGVLGAALTVGGDYVMVDSGQCPTVHMRSHGAIQCSKVDRVYLLSYEGTGRRRALMWSGRYQELLDSLCLDADVVIEEVNGRAVRTYKCPS